MRNLLAVVFPALALALAGCAAMPPSTPAGGTDAVERNKALVRELTEVVWNQRGLDRIPDFYGPDFVADYRPYGLRQGHEGIRASVADAWTAFPDYHEELLELIGEGDRVVVHLTISGTQRGQWGPLPPTGKRVQFEEIVILQIRDGKVRRQRSGPARRRPLSLSVGRTQARVRAWWWGGHETVIAAVAGSPRGSGDGMITRRGFLVATLAAPLGAPPLAKAQQAGKVARIGFLGPPPGTGGQLVESFQQGLRDLGYIEGQNITVEYRWTDVLATDPRQLDVLAAELVRLKVDVLVASITPVIQAAKRATTTIPIVMANAADPVASGFVVSLARPGGNVTGMSRLLPETIGKELDLLKRAVPGTARIGVLSNPDNRLHAHMLSRARREAPVLGLDIEIAEAAVPNQIEAALEALSRKRVGAVLVLGDGMFFLSRAQLGTLLLRFRLPSMFANVEHVEAGGLMSYSASARDNYRRAAYFVDKLLKGARPAELPVEQPIKFELVINVKTAKALGLTIPPSLLVQVDQLIE